MKRLTAAIQFITIIPVGKAGAYDPKGMIPYFPIVGMLLGGLTAAFDKLALQLWSVPVASLLDVILLICLTGAFHLDGLGDAADGLLGHRTRERALAIMKDSRIGVMGLVAIVCGLSMKWAGIASLDANRSIILMLVPAYARAGMVFGIRFLSYGRPENGIGRELFTEKPNIAVFSGCLVPILLSLLLGWGALWLNTGFIAITAIMLRYYKKRIGCITGDMCGAMTEVLEPLLFLICSIGMVR